MMPNKLCSGVKATDEVEVRVSPGLSRRCTLLSYVDGMPYPRAATGAPSVLAVLGKFEDRIGRLREDCAGDCEAATQDERLPQKAAALDVRR